MTSKTVERTTDKVMELFLADVDRLADEIPSIALAAAAAEE